MQTIMDEEQYVLRNQWDNCIVTVMDGVVTHVNLLYCFSAQAHSIPNITRIPSISEGGGVADRIQFQPLKTLPTLIKRHEWLPWDVFKEELSAIGWVHWDKL